MKLSERLEAACTGVLVAEATGNLDIVTDAVNKLLDAAREAAELARRVEGAPVMSVSMVAEGHAVGMYLHPTTDADAAHELTGQRVRLVPEAGLGGGDHG